MFLKAPMFGLVFYVVILVSFRRRGLIRLTAGFFFETKSAKLIYFTFLSREIRQMKLALAYLRGDYQTVLMIPKYRKLEKENSKKLK